MPPATARVKVRVQARGGKILGPAPVVKQPWLTVRNVQTGATLIQDAPMNNQSSGTVVSEFTGTASRNAIVVQPPAISRSYPQPGPWWLEPPKGQGELIAELHLDEPSLLEFRATAFAPDPVHASATMWVTPYMQLIDDPGLVLTIAGLYVKATATAANGTATISANVTMMCGCPITVQPVAEVPSGTEPYWPSTEFNVMAQFRADGGLQVVALPLTCTATSTFTGTQALRSGAYDVWITAIQAKESNVGFARTTLVVT